MTPGEFFIEVMPILARALFVAAACFMGGSIWLVWSRLYPQAAACAGRVALVFWLRFGATALDLIGRPHNFRRRLGQLTRVRVAASVTANGVPHGLSVVTEVQK